MTQSNWQKSLQDEPQKQECKTITQTTRSPSKLLADGTEVTGAKTIFEMKK